MIKLFVGTILTLSLFSTQAQLHRGDKAPEIALPNAHDSTVKLSSFEGKLVLIDFWASWCGPCRTANRHLRQLYKKYKDKGFEVFAVSLDGKKSDWVRAIKHDKLVYTNLIDYDASFSKIAEQYFVDEIPMSFLLDKTGVIVGIDLDGRELEKKILSLIK